MDNQVVSMKVPKAMADAVKKQAAAEGNSVSAFLKKVVEWWLGEKGWKKTGPKSERWSRGR